MGTRRRQSFLAARLALKRIHRQCRHDDQDRPAHGIETVREDSPRPCIRPAKSKETSCSASHDRRFAVAVADPCPLGVDVETVSAKALNCRRIFMRPAEEELVQQSSLNDEIAALRIWSIKEAVAKCTGMDLADAWRRVRVTGMEAEFSRLLVDRKKMTAQHGIVENHLFTLICCNTTTS
jgi:phosphopantetheinyl transferase